MEWTSSFPDIDRRPLMDVSFGVEAAARRFGLDIVRILTEDYFFVCHWQLLETEAMRHIIRVMKSPDFHMSVGGLPGYAVNNAGIVRTAREVLPEGRVTVATIKPAFSVRLIRYRYRPWSGDPSRHSPAPCR